MLLYHHFVQTAKRHLRDFAFVDCTADKRITYSKALTASLILIVKFKKYEKGFIGIMIPTSAWCGLSFLAALMSDRTPVMINYSTGAQKNAVYAQNKCKFKTIITSRVLLEKIDCPVVDGMVVIEDIISGISITDKLRAALTAKLPVPFIFGSIHGGSEYSDCVILFTSGSENDPKAVQLTHRNIASNIRDFSTVIHLSHKDSMLANLPYFHVFGLTVNLLAPLYTACPSSPTQIRLSTRPSVILSATKNPPLWWGHPAFYGVTSANQNQATSRV